MRTSSPICLWYAVRVVGAMTREKNFVILVENAFTMHCAVLPVFLLLLCVRVVTLILGVFQLDENMISA